MVLHLYFNVLIEFIVYTYQKYKFNSLDLSKYITKSNEANLKANFKIEIF